MPPGRPSSICGFINLLVVWQNNKLLPPIIMHLISVLKQCLRGKWPPSQAGEEVAWLMASVCWLGKANAKRLDRWIWYPDRMRFQSTRFPASFLAVIRRHGITHLYAASPVRLMSVIGGQRGREGADNIVVYLASQLPLVEHGSSIANYKSGLRGWFNRIHQHKKLLTDR